MHPRCYIVITLFQATHILGAEQCLHKWFIRAPGSLVCFFNILFFCFQPEYTNTKIVSK